MAENLVALCRKLLAGYSALLTTADVIHDADSQPLFTCHIYMVTHSTGKAYNRSNEHSKL